MPQYKKILISLPDVLLDEVDGFLKIESMSRSEFVRQAMKGYLREYRKGIIAEKLKKGYEEMAEINIAIAEMCFEADNEIYTAYEEKLSESED